MVPRLGPATVGALAGQLGADPGQVSYHPRELAKRGWVEPAPELARAKAIVTQLNTQLIAGRHKRTYAEVGISPRNAPT